MKDSDKKKLDSLVRKEVTKMFESVLDYTSIAVTDEKAFKVLRGKILRVGNDCIRNISSELADYKVEYVASVEDIIEIKNC